MCDAERPAEPLVVVGRLGGDEATDEQAGAGPAKRRGVPRGVLVGAVATWAVVLAAIVWAAT